MDVSSTFQGLSLHDLSTDDESDEEPFKESTEPEHEDPELKERILNPRMEKTHTHGLNVDRTIQQIPRTQTWDTDAIKQIDEKSTRISRRTA